MPYKNPVGTLRESTLDLHHEAERHVRILDPDATAAVYAKYLTRVYGFHAPIERAFAHHDELVRSGFEPRTRSKLALLEDDLAELAVDVATLPACAKLPDTRTLPRALGVAYVIEGSTLGGAFIRSRLRLDVPMRFLAGYGDDTGPMWKAFCAIANRELAAVEAIDDASCAARETFRSLIGWLDEPAREPPYPNRALRRRATA